ncbi:hypothetical protein Cni_G19272 [Canna indica]|uniref:Uncharacterized protein n=1 Tax=Canna indica TaxID=4628 RepID=A0AAQ3QJK4_9LILI|nr:hypothetical protein Cni_G19272 [Canna indica]
MEQQLWRHSGPIPMQKPGALWPAPSLVLLELWLQRHKVRCLKEESLGNKSFDMVVDLIMVHVVVTVFSRVSTVFGPYVLDLPSLPDRNLMLRRSLDLVIVYSCPLEPTRTRTDIYKGQRIQLAIARSGVGDEIVDLPMDGSFKIDGIHHLFAIGF